MSPAFSRTLLVRALDSAGVADVAEVAVAVVHLRPVTCVARAAAWAVLLPTVAAATEVVEASVEVLATAAAAVTAAALPMAAAMVVAAATATLVAPKAHLLGGKRLC